jgi:hypothetical protein
MEGNPQDLQSGSQDLGRHGLGWSPILSVAMILGTRFRDPAAALTRLLGGARPRHEG